jgi:hypothetical protein
MTSDDRHEADARLARLPLLVADAARAERTRLRCRTLLERQRPERPIRPQNGDLRWRVAPAVVGVFCVFYLVYVGALVSTTLQIERLLR